MHDPEGEKKGKPGSDPGSGGSNGGARRARGPLILDKKENSQKEQKPTGEAKKTKNNSDKKNGSPL